MCFEIWTFGENAGAVALVRTSLHQQGIHCAFNSGEKALNRRCYDLLLAFAPVPESIDNHFHQAISPWQQADADSLLKEGVRRYEKRRARLFLFLKDTSGAAHLVQQDAILEIRKEDFGSTLLLTNAVIKTPMKPKAIFSRLEYPKDFCRVENGFYRRKEKAGEAK